MSIDRTEASRELARAIAHDNAGNRKAAQEAAARLVAMLRRAGLH